MGNLLTQTCTFQELIKKYSNFIVPAVKIKVDSKEITESLKVTISDVTVTLELDDASSATFTVTSAYELTNSAFAGKVKSSLKLGEILTVELGYGSALTQVFQGFISNLTMEFGKLPSITVTALDIRALMRRNIREITYSQMKVSDVVTKVLEAYQKICPKIRVTGTKDQPSVIIQNSSDYEFIKEELGAVAKSEFFVLGDTAYFREMRKPDTPIMTLEYQKGLISFSCSITYCNEEIRIYGHDEKKNETVEVKRNVKSEANLKEAISARPIKEIRVSHVEDKTTAENIAEYELNERMKSTQSGRGSCIGMPELVPGRFLKIDQLDDSVNKTYYLRQVTHSISQGFTTEFEIGGWK